MLEAFGETDVNVVSVEGQCCDVCDEEVKHLRDCRKELEVAVDTIEVIGSKGEVKLTESICGNKRPWMENLDKTRMSFGRGLGHSEKWWRSFLRKCHVLGFLERKLGHLIKANHHYAILATYHATQKGYRAIHHKEQILLNDTEGDVVKRKLQPISDQSCSSTNPQSLHPPTTKHRAGKGGRIIDTVMELMSNRDFWEEVSCPADYHYLGVFSKERMQCMLFIPNISQLKTHAKMSDDFVWRDIQLSKGTVNGPRPVPIWACRRKARKTQL